MYAAARFGAVPARGHDFVSHALRVVYVVTVSHIQAIISCIRGREACVGRLHFVIARAEVKGCYEEALKLRLLTESIGVG